MRKSGPPVLSQPYEEVALCGQPFPGTEKGSQLSLTSGSTGLRPMSPMSMATGRLEVSGDR